MEVLGNALDGIKDLCEIKGMEMIEEYGYPQRRGRRESYGYDDYPRGYQLHICSYPHGAENVPWGFFKIKMFANVFAKCR